MVEGRGYWRETDGSAISRETAMRAWRKVAHLHLSELAGTAHATLTQDELATHVQERTGIHTSIATGRWMAPLLTATAQLCRERREPPLTTLVVQANGTVGPAYDVVLQLQLLPPIDDPRAREEHAARARIECHQWAGVPEPEGGWVPRRPVTAGPRAVAARTPRARSASAGSDGGRPKQPARRAAPEPALAICPGCFLALPATGVCGTCD